jgi:hypothetical protein
MGSEMEGNENVHDCNMIEVLAVVDIQQEENKQQWLLDLNLGI